MALGVVGTAFDQLLGHLDGSGIAAVHRRELLTDDIAGAGSVQVTISRIKCH